jgi:catechol 2,3-dioxygenase-like lactoylglutathione lyase family enzyme
MGEGQIVPKPEVSMSAETAVASETAQLANAIPILRVEDLDASLDYYTKSLGFKMNWRAGNFASVGRDTCGLMLAEGEQGHAGTWLWVPAADVEVLHAEWLGSGAMIRQGPTNFPWGSLEIQVTDPDGHVLRFGSDGKKDMPYGPWMDAEGRLWPMTDDGGSVLENS